MNKCFLYYNERTLSIYREDRSNVSRHTVNRKLKIRRRRRLRKRHLNNAYPVSLILKDFNKVHEKKKKVVVFCSRSRQTVKLGTDFQVVGVMCVQSCCFANINLLLFCLSRVPSPLQLSIS